MRRSHYALAALLAAAVLAACAPQPTPKQHLVVGITDRPFSGLVAIAEKRGLFSANGLDVEVRKMSDSAARISALSSGTIDVAHAPDFAFATASFEETQFRIICQTSHAVDHQVAVRRGAGITKPKDLVGKRIGVSKGSQFEFVLQRILANAGLSERDVQIVDLQTNEAPAALASGTVDAIVTFCPLRAQAAQELDGKADYWSLAESGAETWSLLAVRADATTKKAKALEAFVRSLVQAQQWAEANPDAALTLVRTWSRERAAYPSGWPAQELFVALSERLSVRLNEEIAWIAKSEDRAVPADASVLLDPEPLRAVDRSLVTVTSP
jgi:ABC-type nitrate/sulfonate/bicarbonate transport system substrate-binding protein